METMNKSLTDYGIYVQFNGQQSVYTLCPNCSGKRKKANIKCLTVTYHESGNHFWNCSHCGWSGGVFKGVKGEIQEKQVLPKIILDNPMKLTDELISWFKSNRGIQKNALERMQIGFAKKFFPTANKELPCIAFPRIRKGNIVGCKYIALKREENGSKHIIQDKGGMRTVYGYDNIGITDCLYITEGEIDCLSLIEVGYPNTISVPDGAPSVKTENYESKFEFLADIEQELENINKVVLVTDNDEAGIKLRDELARRIGQEKCYTVKYPQGCKDANDVLTKESGALLQACLMNAKPIPIQGIVTASDIENEVNKIYETGIISGHELPWENVKNLYKIAMGEFTVVTGYPGSGKSEFVECVALHLSDTLGIPLAIFSPEHAIAWHIIRLAEKLIKKPFPINGVEKNPLIDYMKKEEFEVAKKWINIHVLFIRPDRKQRLDPEAHMKLKQSLVLKYGCKLFIDDPYNRMDHNRPKDKTTEEYVSWFLEVYGEFDERFGTHSFLVAHPKSPDEKQKSKKVMIADPSRISGGAMWWNKSPNILSVGRAKDFTVIAVKKLKWKWNGMIGSGNLEFDVNTGTFKDYNGKSS